MATIISPVDFTVDNEIPNKSLQGNDIQTFINKYEPKFLESLMGESLYAAYIAQPTDARFVNLLAQDWFKPAIVDYVFWFYLNRKSNQQFNTGAAQPKKQNATTISNYPNMVQSWNEMVGYNKKTNKFLKDNETIYPEYKPVCLPEWYFAYDGFSWFYPGFDSSWYYGFGCYELPEIYRLKNSLGL